MPSWFRLTSRGSRSSNTASRPEDTVATLVGTARGCELTPLKGNKLWQLGLLELWLQTHRIG